MATNRNEAQDNLQPFISSPSPPVLFSGIKYSLHVLGFTCTATPSYLMNPQEECRGSHRSSIIVSSSLARYS